MKKKYQFERRSPLLFLLSHKIPDLLISQFHTSTAPSYTPDTQPSGQLFLFPAHRKKAFPVSCDI